MCTSYLFSQNNIFFLILICLIVLSFGSLFLQEEVSKRVCDQQIPKTLESDTLEQMQKKSEAYTACLTSFGIIETYKVWLGIEKIQIDDSSTLLVFPLNSEDADYTIIKLENSYSLNYKKKNPRVMQDDLSLLIGVTPTDLDEFVDKKVRVTGSFITGTPYCKGECSRYLGSEKRPVVKIDTIELYENSDTFN